jgi:cell division protein FtsB
VRGGLARYFLAPLGGLALAAAFLAVDSENGLRRLLSMRIRAAELDVRIADLQGQRERLERSVKGLRTDPLAVERLAREKLGLVREGETIVRLPEVGAPADALSLD